MNTGISSLDRAEQKAVDWMRELGQELGSAPGVAWSVFRAVMHSLRNRLTPDEAVDRGSQLPTVLRGVYYEGWDPSQCPSCEKSKEEFLTTVAEPLLGIPTVEIEQATRAVFRLLERRITSGEIGDVTNILPNPIQALWYGEAEERRVPRARLRQARKGIRHAVAEARARGVGESATCPSSRSGAGCESRGIRAERERARRHCLERMDLQRIARMIADPFARLRIGTRYDVVRTLGSRALLARDLDRSLVVLKSPVVARRELTDLRHPAIVPFEAFGVLPDGREFGARRYVEGRTAEPGDYPGCAELLRVLHDLGVHHRNLKKTNILIGDRGEIRFVDWGPWPGIDDWEALTSALGCTITL